MYTKHVHSRKEHVHHNWYIISCKLGVFSSHRRRSGFHGLVTGWRQPFSVARTWHLSIVLRMMCWGGGPTPLDIEGDHRFEGGIPECTNRQDSRGCILDRRVCISRTITPPANIKEDIFVKAPDIEAFSSRCVLPSTWWFSSWLVGQLKHSIIRDTCSCEASVMLLVAREQF